MAAINYGAAPTSHGVTGEGFVFRAAAAHPSAIASAAVDQEGGAPDGGPPKRLARGALTPRNVFLLVGTLSLLLVIVTPLWDATRLLDDPANSYFVGKSLPMWTISVSLGVVLVYGLMITFYFGCAKQEFRSDQAVSIVNLVVIAGLGLSLLALSQPLMSQSMSAYEELFANCGYGPRTQQLASYAEMLQGLRSSPACASTASVELCEGYAAVNDGQLTGVLKALESQYKCAGFCPASRLVATGSAQPSAATLLISAASSGKAGAPQPADAGAGTRALATPGASGAPQRGLAGALQRFANSGRPLQATVGARRQLDAPQRASLLQVNASSSAEAPSLFSLADASVSCDGAAGRSLMFMGVTTGRVLYWEGVLLLLVASVAGLLRGLHGPEALTALGAAKVPGSGPLRPAAH